MQNEPVQDKSDSMMGPWKALILFAAILGIVLAFGFGVVWLIKLAVP